MYNYGDCLVTGEGVKENRELGLQWLRRSLQAGYEPARNRIGQVVFKPIGDKIMSALGVWAAASELYSGIDEYNEGLRKTQEGIDWTKQVQSGGGL